MRSPSIAGPSHAPTAPDAAPVATTSSIVAPPATVDTAITPVAIPPTERSNKTTTQTFVIGSGVLKDSHADMELLQIPNWLQSAQKEFLFYMVN